jgi:tetratricopeptide (TPR) repeat protein
MRRAARSAVHVGVLICTTLTLTAPPSSAATASETDAHAAHRLCEVGDTYRDAHRDADALAAYKQALEKDPHVTCASDGVKATGDVAASWRTAIVDVVRHPLVALGIVVALLLLILNLAWRPLSRVWLIGRFFSPRMKLAALDETAATGHPGSPLAARIVERLQAFHREAQHAEHSLDLSVDDEAYFRIITGNSRLADALSKAADVSEQTKLAAALVGVASALAPRPLLTVQGVLDPPDGAASATFTLTAGYTLNAAAHLSVPSVRRKVEAIDYLRIADSAAAWVQFESGCWLDGSQTRNGAAESYAAVRDGLERHLEGRERDARTAFLRAIQLDSRNWAARVNLALTEARLRGAYERAIGTLRVAYRDHVGEPAA